MPYYCVCEKCGAHLDRGEVCACDCAEGVRTHTVEADEPIIIAQKPTRKETEREIDRALWMALQRHRAQKATKKRGRR